MLDESVDARRARRMLSIVVTPPARSPRGFRDPATQPVEAIIRPEARPGIRTRQVRQASPGSDRKDKSRDARPRGTLSGPPEHDL